MMKKYISILIITLAVAGSSCKKTYLSELAVNPNSPSIASPPLLLSGALKTTAGILNGGGYTMYACWVGYLSWSTGFQANTALEQYQFTTSSYDVWTPLYGNLSNYNALMSANAGPYYTAIAKIMTVVDYQQLVDNYGNVPYSQALKGTLNLTPAYDSGQAIYTDLMVQLDAAIALITGAPTLAVNPGAADVMYGGNMTNWKKFANTLKLRLAIRQSALSSGAAAKTAAAATASIGYINASSPAAVNPGYINSDAFGGQASPLWINYGYSQAGGATTNNQEYQANQFAINFFSSNSDPRLSQVYAPNPSGNVIGSVFGATVTYPTAGVTPSKLGPGVLKSPTMSAMIMSGPESLFLQAEGIAAGIITDPDFATAQAAYNAGVTASFTDDGLTAGQATTYLANAGAYPAGTFAVQQQAIITQKWAALLGYGALEAFNELRRTGYPAVPVSIYPGVTQTNNVTRLYYPFVEYSTNAGNVALQPAVNPFVTKIFWAK